MDPSEVREQNMTNGAIDESQNVERIRNILFGSQMRDYDGRFQRVEERFDAQAQELRQDLQKSGSRPSKPSCGERVNRWLTGWRRSRRERSQATERLGRDLGETARHFEEKITKLDGQMAKEVRELRQQVLDQSKALSAEIKDKFDQLKAGLEHEAKEIRNAMTGREALAEMLSEISLRLKNEFKVPGGS